MIDSGLFTKSVLALKAADKATEIEDIEQELSGSVVNKSVMFHIINSYIYLIYSNADYQPLLKNKYVSEFGKKLGFNLAEQQSMGFMKYYSSNKNDGKQFVAEMKLLNSKIWNSLFGNKGKLFAISNENLTSSSYKIEDKQFSIGKSLKNSTNSKEIQYRQLILCFCEGAVNGCIDKFEISGEITVGEAPEGDIYVELKNLVHINSVTKYEEYSESFKDKQSV